MGAVPDAPTTLLRLAHSRNKRRRRRKDKEEEEEWDDDIDNEVGGREGTESRALKCCLSPQIDVKPCTERTFARCFAALTQAR